MFKGLKSLIAGVVAGTALGLLFSPKKGEELRKNIKEEVTKGGSGLNTVKASLKTMGREIGDTAKEVYDEITETEEFKKGLKEAKKVYKKHVPAKTRRQVQQAVSKTKKVAGAAKSAAKKATGKAKKTVEKIKKK